MSGVPIGVCLSEGSVSALESASANCRNYPPSNLQSDDHPEDYIHCDEAQFKLTDQESDKNTIRPRTIVIGAHPGWRTIIHIHHKSLLDYYHTALPQ